MNELLGTTDLTELFGSAQLAALTAAASARPVVLLLETESPLADLVVPTMAAALLPTAASRVADLRVLAPESTNWSVDEISTQILTPASLTPNVRNLIVIHDAQKMSAACADHLLKAIEEPLAPTTFVLVTPSADLLMPTIKGRVGQHVSLSLPADALVRWLEGLGCSPTTAARAVKAFGPAAASLAALEATPGQLEELVELATTLPPPTMAATVAMSASTLLSAISAGAPSENDTEASTPATATKKRARSLALSIVAAWRTTVLTTLRSRPDLAPRASLRLSGFDRAEEILRRNGPVDLALATALVG